MLKVRVIGLAVDSRSQPVILLKPVDDEELGSGRVLPIWIGPQEATSIFLAVQGTPAPRPLSHDLMATILGELGAGVDRVEITRVEESTFYAEIVLVPADGSSTVVDARPSDAIALAGRVGAPIWVAEDVFSSSSLPESLGEDDSGQTPDPADEETKIEEFREFINHVDPEDFKG